MNTRYANPIRVSRPAWWRRAAPVAFACSGTGKRRGAGVVCGTQENGRAGQGVILSQETVAAGRQARRGSEEIRCAPDLIRAPKERADG